MSVEIKVFFPEKEDGDNLCFHAVIHNKDDYDIFYDLADTYEILMKEALSGTFIFKYRNRVSLKKEIYTINKDNYLDNINLFIKFLKRFYNLNAKSNENYVKQIMGVRLVGAGFRGQQNIPMLESEQFNAMNSMHKIKTQLFLAVNNINYIRDDIYIKKSQGSLRLTLEATQNYNDAIEFMQIVYNDIENMAINPFQFEDKNKQERYQKIIYSLNELNKQKRLQKFYIIIGNKEFEVKQRTYLKEETKNIYNESIELKGNFESYSIDSKSFKLKTNIFFTRLAKMKFKSEVSILTLSDFNYHWIQFCKKSNKKATFFCHLEELFINDKNQFEKMLKIIKAQNVFNNNLVSIKGERVKPKTINVVSIEFI